MRMNLNDLEIRVLGCLMEKELTTPEYYPLTLNALLAACNQKSNRNPQLALTEVEVEEALKALGGRGIARLTTTGGRVGKYCHSMTEKLGLGAKARAVLAELMLRGPQTAGELRNRGERMAPIADVAEAEALLLELQRLAPPLVMKLPRQPGHKEQRYRQLFSGAPEVGEIEPSEAAGDEAGPDEAPVAPRIGRVRDAVSGAHSAGGGDRLGPLESEIGLLRGEVGELRKEVEELLALFT